MVCVPTITMSMVLLPRASSALQSRRAHHPEGIRRQGSPPNVIAENNFALKASSRRIVFKHSPHGRSGSRNQPDGILTSANQPSLSPMPITPLYQPMIIDRDSDSSGDSDLHPSGVSFSNSLQPEANYEPVRGLDLTWPIARTMYDELAMKSERSY